MTRGALQRLGQGERLIEDRGGPTIRLQSAWQEVVEYLEDLSDSKQDADADLAAYAALTGTGLVARTGAGTAATRTLTGPAAGLTVTNGNGVAGNPTLALANDLAALEAIATTGLAKRTGTDTWATIVHDEGTFTPTFTFGGGSTGMTFSERTGVYRRVGGLWLVEIRIVLTAKGSSTGDAVIGMLPAIAVGRSTGISVAGNYVGADVPTGVTLPGTATILLRNVSGGNATTMTHANFADNTAINLTIAYSA